MADPKIIKVTPCGHPVPKGRKVCDRCKEARKKAYDRNYAYTVRRKRKAKKG